MKFENVIAFSEQSKDLAEAMKEFAREVLNERKGLKSFEKHSREDMNKLINKAFSIELGKLTGSEVPTAKNDIARYVTRTNVTEFANETRDVLIDMILPDVLMDSSLNYLADIKYADFGDSIKFEIPSQQLLTVSKAGYRKRRTDVQKTYRNDITMTGTNHQISVSTNLFDILIGKSYLAEEIMKSALAIETALAFDIYDAFTASANALTGSLAVANYSADSLVHLCQVVEAKNMGAKPVIIGTELALSKVLPSDTQWRYFLDSEYVKIGHLQNFRGFDVVPMKQVANPYDPTDEYALKLDDTKIYVVSPASDKIVKVGIFGGTMSHQNDPYDNANLSVINTINETYEVSVLTASVAGVVKSLS